MSVNNTPHKKYHSPQSTRRAAAKAGTASFLSKADRIRDTFDTVADANEVDEEYSIADYLDDQAAKRLRTSARDDRRQLKRFKNETDIFKNTDESKPIAKTLQDKTSRVDTSDTVRKKEVSVLFEKKTDKKKNASETALSKKDKSAPNIRTLDMSRDFNTEEGRQSGRVGFKEQMTKSADELFKPTIGDGGSKSDSSLFVSDRGGGIFEANSQKIFNTESKKAEAKESKSSRKRSDKNKEKKIPLSKKELAKQGEKEYGSATNAGSAGSVKKKLQMKAAAKRSVANMLEAKKNIRSDATSFNDTSTGDLIADGNTGALRVLTDGAKAFGAEIGRTFASGILKYLGFIIAIFIGFTLFISPLISIFISISSIFTAPIASIFGDIGVTSYSADVTGDGYTFAHLSDEEIEAILNNVTILYPETSSNKLSTLYYSLIKVGCSYDQNYHGNTSVDIFDCSSLVYRSYMAGGLDISNYGIYTAAEECKALENAGMKLGDSFTLMPGDLLFYGGSSNGRYKGIYHVAMYIGKDTNGIDKMVEARGTSWGVVYGDVRMNNVVSICRPVI